MSDELQLGCKWDFRYIDETIRPTQPNFGKLALGFESVCMFWRIYNNVIDPCRLKPGFDYLIFRSDYISTNIEEAEDIDSDGECYFDHDPQIRIAITKKQSESRNRRNSGLIVDPRFKQWVEYSILLVIGETIAEDSHFVNGIVISSRKSESRICISIKNKTEVEKIEQIKAVLKHYLKIPDNDDDVIIKVVN